MPFTPLIINFRRIHPHTYIELEWDAASSVRLTSPRASDEIEDGFTTVQGPKAKRQNRAQAAQANKNFTPIAVNSYNTARADPRPIPTGPRKPQWGGPERGRGRGRGRNNRHGENVKERPDDRAPLPDRSSTRRLETQNEAELASRRGEPAAGEILLLPAIEFVGLIHLDRRVQLHDLKKGMQSPVSCFGASMLR